MAEAYIKRCPFCGSPGYVLSPRSETDPRGFKVTCPWKGCPGHVTSETAEGAIAAWNTRHSDD